MMLLGFRALGAEASPLPFRQLYAALQAGVFDGQENPIATIVSAKFTQVQKFLTLSAHVYDPAAIVMASDAHDDLSAEDRAIVLRRRPAHGRRGLLWRRLRSQASLR
jgi:TRAP-type C4-dicarboxylate transport system substrate-binding protein